ncbi:MAG: xanthine dehydrogenase family protein subunit M [Alphaproteobacteria bacterium]|nr:xanthine dehydrogenase family protein subunit M [Alphaproteobacteria bacterium]
MKPANFSYIRAGSIEEAVEIMSRSDGEARFLSGGQSLIPALNFRLGGPSLLIDLNSIPGLSGIRMEGAAIIIGALTRHTELGHHPLISTHLPLLTEAVQHVAHPAIRNRGTFGGSLALADPSAELPACVLALRAVVKVVGPGGQRVIAADDFFVGGYTTALAPDELLTEVHIPLPNLSARHGFAELTRRRGDYAMVGLALMTGPQQRVVWFGLADRPLRDQAAEDALSGGPRAAAAAALSGSEVWGDLHASAATKTHLARVMIRRLLERIT